MDRRGLRLVLFTILFISPINVPLWLRFAVTDHSTVDQYRMQFGNLNGRKSTKAAVEPTAGQRTEGSQWVVASRKNRKMNKENLFEGIHQELQESRIVAYHVDLVVADVPGML